MKSELQIRLHGSPARPALVYLPGLHGDWTLIPGFRSAVSDRVHFAEISYPRTTSWLVEDHARNVEAALFEKGVTEGWLLAESFSSLTAWRMIERSYHSDSHFRIRGLILAGGFVKHPWPWGATLLRTLTARAPNGLIRVVLTVYCAYARFHHRDTIETRESFREFVVNRLHPNDRRAMLHRFTLIMGDDARPVACASRLPVYCLSGLLEPVVPYPLVRRWLKQNCPGYRDSAMIWTADHNVLGTAPYRSAEVVFGWMTSDVPMPTSHRSPSELRSSKPNAV